ncbi:MAG TPA: HAD-IA family hydrolase [Burkholderiales bacterium]|nr:HAD-IA family hydrolase [Burkholderiales bacterium]
MSPRRFDLLVFDWDGTLMDSAAHIAQALQQAFRDLDMPVPTDEAARHVIGLGLEDAMNYLRPGLERVRYSEVSERYRVHFLAGDHKIELFEHVAEGIPALKEDGYLLAIATGKSRRGLDRSLEFTGLSDHFHASRCADEGFPKPHPEMLQVVMEMLGTTPDRTLMIGDTTHDLQMAQNAGVAAIGITHGAHPGEHLEAMKPLACVPSFGDLLLWLKQSG